MLLPSRESSPFHSLKPGDERLLEVLLWEGLLGGRERRNRPLTQEELAERTGLSRNSIKSYTSTKLRDVLNVDGSLSLQSDVGYSIGVDFGGTHQVRVLLTNLHGDDEAESQAAPGPPPEKQETWRTIEMAVEGIWKAMEERSVGPDKIVGVGIGIPTPPVPREETDDPAFGIWKLWGDPGIMLRNALNQWWEAKEEIKGAWDSVRFASANDTNLTAIADHLWGGGPSSDQSIFIKWQSSVRAALILDGQLYTGGSGFAGELPHVQVKDAFKGLEDVKEKHCDWKDCPAGDGCLYAIAPIDKLVHIAESGAGVKIEGSDRAGEIVKKASQPGNEALLELLYRSAEGIGKAIGSLALGINPDTVLIGGALGARAYPLVLEKLRKGVVHQTGVEDFLVTNSTIRNRGTALGAAALALLKYGPGYLKPLALASSSGGKEQSRRPHSASRRTAAAA